MIVIPKTSGEGILVDTTTPTYSWKDLIGQIVPRATGEPAPTLAAINGTRVLSYTFAANDVIDEIVYHIPHDYVPNTDLLLHLHWCHNGTAISGNFVVNWYHQYAKRDSGQFSVEKNITQTIPCNITTYPRYKHNVTEFPLTTIGGSVTLADTSIIEVDALLLVSLVVTTIPTITGGTPNTPFILTADIHYQSTNVGTKNNIAPFYA